MVRWGFIGAGWVASTAMAPAVHSANNAILQSVASRDFTKASALNGKNSYNSYEDLIHDPQIDAVYISLPNHLHCEWTLKALSAGKHVLVEKPFAINLEEAQAMVAAAIKNKRHLSEVLWNQFHPRYLRAMELIGKGDLGQIGSIESAFTFSNKFEGNFRLDPMMGGGSFMDVGPYQLHTWISLVNEVDFAITRLDKVVGESGIDLTTEILGTLNNSIEVKAATSIVRPELQSLLIKADLAEIEFLGNDAFTSWKEPSTLRIGSVIENFDSVDAFQLMIENFGEQVEGGAAWLSTTDRTLKVMQLMSQVTNFRQ